MGALVKIAKEQSLQQILSQFLDNFLSQNTRDAYINDLNHFSQFMSAEFGDVLHPTQIRTSHIIRYREELRTAYAPGTVNRRISTLSSVFRELMEHQIIERNPVSGIKRPPVKTIRPTLGFSDEEVALILGSFDVTKLSGLQQKSIFSFLFFTGARISELLQLRVGDIEMRSGTPVVILKGKGDKVRVLPLHGELHELLLELISIRKKSEENFLFTSTRSDLDKPLARMTVHDLLKRTLKKLDLETDRSCHSSRRTLISNLLENGSRLEEVQKIAGHASPTTTVRYNVRSEELDKSPLLKVDFKKK